MLSYSGSYTGNGLTSQTISGLPFAWEILLIKAGMDSTADTWFKTIDMPPLESVPMRTDQNLQTNRIAIGSDAYSFNVGNNVAVNQSGYPYYFLALADNGMNDFSRVAYLGDNTDDKLVFANWQPDYALLKGDMNITGCRKFSGQISATGNQNSNDAMPNFQGATFRHDLVYFGSDGMRVSNGSNSGGNLINQAGLMCYGFVLKNTAGLIQSGTYTGNGVASTITTGVNPIFIDVHHNNGNNPTIQYQGEQASGLTTAWDNAPATGIIPSVTSTGFNVSTDPNVNTSGQQYWYMNLAAQTSGTLHNVTGAGTITGIGSQTF